MKSHCLSLAWGLLLLFSPGVLGQQLPLEQREPKWWSKEGTSIWGAAGRPAIPENSATINVGQLKHVVSMAKEYLNTIIGDFVVFPETGAGAEINALVAAFQAGSENAAVANVGQLKAVADLFYRRFHDLGLTANDLGDDMALEVIQRLNAPAVSVRIPNPASSLTPPLEYRVPWAVPVLPSEHAAAANIGQLKLVFGFELDDDNDDLLDAYERFIIAAWPGDTLNDLGDIDPLDQDDQLILPSADSNGDGVLNWQEFKNRSNPFSVDVSSQLQLENAIRDTPPPPRIRVVSTFTVAQRLTEPLMDPITIPAATALDFAPGAMLLKGAGADLVINGPIPNRPEQFFAPGSGAPPVEWEPGEIRGKFGGMARLAEWWGARASDPAEGDDTRGINCAVGAIIPGPVAQPKDADFTVQLGGGNYAISCPIIMTNTRCTLRGRDSFGTGLYAKRGTGRPPGWRWIDHKCRFDWFRRVNPLVNGNLVLEEDDNHVAMIYVGGISFSASNPNASLLEHRGSEAQALTNVYDVYLQPLGETEDLAPPSEPPGSPDNTRMSLISCLHNEAFTVTSSVGPGTVLEGINGAAYAAHGIGFCQDTIVNGLEIRSFHINGYGPQATATGNPIFLPPTTNGCKIDKGTVGGGERMFIPQNSPATLAIVGIVVQGTNVDVTSIHAEHCHVGLDIVASQTTLDSPAKVTATNIDYWTADTVTQGTVPPGLKTLSWAPRNAVVRIRGYQAEDQAPGDNKLDVEVKNAFTWNSGAVDGYGAASIHNLLYEPGGPWGDPALDTAGQVRAFDGAKLPSMTYYERKHPIDPLRKPLF